MIQMIQMSTQQIRPWLLLGGGGVGGWWMMVTFSHHNQGRIEFIRVSQYVSVYWDLTWVIIPNGVLSSGATISVTCKLEWQWFCVWALMSSLSHTHKQPLTSTNPHSKTPETEKAMRKRKKMNWKEILKIDLKKNSVLTNHDVVDREGRNNTGYNL